MTSMIFWFKSFNTPGHQVYSVGQINMYPLGIQTVQVITSRFSLPDLSWLMGIDPVHISYWIRVLV